LNVQGEPIARPVDWQPAIVEVLADAASWRDVQLESSAGPLQPYVQRLNGRERILAAWPRMGPGAYRLRLSLGGEVLPALDFAIAPAKISQAAFHCLLADLETHLPAAIAVALQRTGGLTGLKLLPPQLSTRAQELQRLRRAILGHAAHPGLVKILDSLSGDPHRLLRRVEPWVQTERARRPVASKLALAVSRGHNLDEQGLPFTVVDAHVEHTFDVYENRLVRTFHMAVDRRLNRLLRSLETDVQAAPPGQAGPSAALGEARELRQQLQRARRRADFLDEVGQLQSVPERVTMVLLNRPPYRAALEGYYDFLRTVWVRLEEPALEGPLENFPRLYEVWGTLQIMLVLLEVAAELGYRLVGEQRLTGLDGAGLYIRLMPDGQPVATLQHAGSGTQVSLIPQKAYGKSGLPSSISFQQVPDVTLHVQHSGEPPVLYLFDPKYKLDSQQGGDGDASPKKEDIDKMHAYRDAIRGANNASLVRYAAILYPGLAASYGPQGAGLADIAALPADPEATHILHRHLRTVLTHALLPSQQPSLNVGSPEITSAALELGPARL
jgi:hypothetical protein